MERWRRCGVISGTGIAQSLGSRAKGLIFEIGAVFCFSVMSSLSFLGGRGGELGVLERFRGCASIRGRETPVVFCAPASSMICFSKVRQWGWALEGVWSGVGACLKSSFSIGLSMLIRSQRNHRIRKIKAMEQEANNWGGNRSVGGGRKKKVKDSSFLWSIDASHVDVGGGISAG